MKLIEALETLRTEPPSGARPFRVSLVCSFTPAHLQTFLQAHLARALPENRVQMTSGLYGDFWGNLARLQQENPDAGVLVMEWSDLDPRLGGQFPNAAVAAGIVHAAVARQYLRTDSP